MEPSSSCRQSTFTCVPNEAAKNEADRTSCKPLKQETDLLDAVGDFLVHSLEHLLANNFCSKRSTLSHTRSKQQLTYLLLDQAAFDR
jgi:hypothetical protein